MCDVINDLLKMFCLFSARVLRQQDLPHVPALQHPEGHDQGRDASSGLHGAQTRIQVKNPVSISRIHFFQQLIDVNSIYCKSQVLFRYPTQQSI